MPDGICYSMNAMHTERTPAGEHWEPGVVQGDDVGEIRWLAMPQCHIGIGKHGEWVYLCHGDPVAVGAASDLTPLFVLLGYTESEFRGMLRTNLVALGFPVEMTDTFPGELLILAVLRSGDHVQCGRGLNWLEQGMPLTREIAIVLGDFITFKRGIHRDRHRASRLLQRYGRGLRE